MPKCHKGGCCRGRAPRGGARCRGQNRPVEREDTSQGWNSDYRAAATGDDLHAEELSPDELVKKETLLDVE